MNTIKNIILLIGYIFMLPLISAVFIIFCIMWVISCLIDKLIDKLDENYEMDIWKINEIFDDILSKMYDKVTGYEDIY